MTGKLSFLGAAAASLAIAGTAHGDHRAGGRPYGPIAPVSDVYTPDPSPRCDVPQKVWVPDQYEVRQRHVVIPAEYKTVYERVWVQPVYEWVTRRVPAPRSHRRNHVDVNFGKFSLHLNLRNRHRSQRRGYYKTIRKRVLIREGYYEAVARDVLVRPARVEVVHDKVLVQKGFWKVIDPGPIEPYYDSGLRRSYGDAKRKAGLRRSKSLRRVGHAIQSRS